MLEFSGYCMQLEEGYVFLNPPKCINIFNDLQFPLVHYWLSNTVPYWPFFLHLKQQDFYFCVLLPPQWKVFPETNPILTYISCKTQNYSWSLCRPAFVEFCHFLQNLPWLVILTKRSYHLHPRHIQDVKYKCAHTHVCIYRKHYLVGIFLKC